MCILFRISDTRYWAGGLRGGEVPRKRGGSGGRSPSGNGNVGVPTRASPHSVEVHRSSPFIASALPRFLNGDRITGARSGPKAIRYFSAKTCSAESVHKNVRRRHVQKVRREVCRYVFRWTDGICCDGRVVSHIHRVSRIWRPVRTLRSVRESGRCKRAGLTGTTTALPPTRVAYAEQGRIAEAVRGYFL